MQNIEIIEDPGALDDGLTPRQERALASLMTEPTVARAAESAGVGERTLRRWLREEPFASRYRAMRRDAFDHAITLTHRYAAAAVTTLARVMADPGASAASRVAAAVAMVRIAREGIELDDLAQRVARLEASVSAREDA